MLTLELLNISLNIDVYILPTRETSLEGID